MDLALVAFWRPFAGIRVGAGPAWYRLTATPDGGADLTVSKIGWIAEAGLVSRRAQMVRRPRRPVPGGGLGGLRHVRAVREGAARAGADLPRRNRLRTRAFVAGIGFRF